MPRTVLVRGARQLLTLHGPKGPRRGPALRELSIIRDGALLIEDGRIVEVGPSRRVENLAQARVAHEIDATGRVVMPGFVDCHTHLIGGLPLGNGFHPQDGEADDLPYASESPAHALRNVSAKRLESKARRVIQGMIRHGTTTLEAKSGWGLDEAGELKMLRVLAKLNNAPLDVVPTFLNPKGVLPELQNQPPSYVSWMCEKLMPIIQRRGLARFADFHCGGWGLDMEQTNCWLRVVQALGFRVKFHIGQEQHNLGVGLAVAHEAISADHVDYADHSDVDLLAHSNTIAVLLPGAAFHSGRDWGAPARELIDQGAAVALATDFSRITSPTYNMQMIVALACSRMRMTAAEAICAATFNAACAIGCAPRVGSFETGKSADLILLDAADYREIPEHFGVNLVGMAMKRGVVVYAGGQIRAA